MLDAPARRPSPVALAGRHVRIGPTVPKRDAADLFPELSGPSAERLFRYLPAGPFANEAALQADLAAASASLGTVTLAIRDAVQGLPEPGKSPGTPEAAAALARENARAMAHNLESLKLEEAAEDARRTVAALNEAHNKAQGQTYFQGELERARATVEQQQRWVQQQLEVKRAAARERAKSALEQHSALEEKLAGMASELARQGDERNNPLPSEVTGRLRQAGADRATHVLADAFAC